MDQSLSITGSSHTTLGLGQKIALLLASVTGIYLLVQPALNDTFHKDYGLVILICGFTLATALYIYTTYAHKPSGISNDHNFFSSLTARGAIGWILGVVFTGFYVLLYWFPTMLGVQEGTANSGIVRLFDPLSYVLNGNAASQWFMYGTLYSLAIVLMGIKFIIKYRHNRYQIIRTTSVMFFQLGFAFLLPELLMRMRYPWYDAKNIWPLNYGAFSESSINTFTTSGSIGMAMLLWSVILVIVLSPILTYFYGKRWYCSWVCGCGGLAETAGDPFRHLSDKSLTAWRVERWLIHLVLVFVTYMTWAVLHSYLMRHSDKWLDPLSFTMLSTLLFGGIMLWVALDTKRFKTLDRRAKVLGILFLSALILLLWHALYFERVDLLWLPSWKVQQWYGFLIGAAFSGVIGVGFYPILGSRVWCRFGCPMAAILGIQQKFFSRFRISTNGNQCISCGNCSTYCEMGIDVKWYAQRGQNIVRASCVGCGICATVCPRGVLRLENGPNTYSKAEEVKGLHIGSEDISLI